MIINTRPVQIIFIILSACVALALSQDHQTSSLFVRSRVQTPAEKNMVSKILTTNLKKQRDSHAQKSKSMQDFFNSGIYRSDEMHLLPPIESSASFHKGIADSHSAFQGAMIHGAKASKYNDIVKKLQVARLEAPRQHD